MREVLVGFQRPVLQQLGRQRSGGDIGNDLIVFAMRRGAAGVGFQRRPLRMRIARFIDAQYGRPAVPQNTGTGRRWF
jgi:hypothetical protein